MSKIYVSCTYSFGEGSAPVWVKNWFSAVVLMILSFINFLIFYSWLTDWGVINWIVMENWSQITDLSHVLEITEVSLQNLEPCAPLFLLFWFILRLFVHYMRGGMCLDAWNNKTRQEECIFTCFYFQMIKIKEIFEEIVSLDTSELRFGSVQSFPPPYLHKEPGWKQ